MAANNDEVQGKVGRMCTPCLKKNIQHTADVFCTTCNEFQCYDCSNIHSVYSFMADHKLLNASDGQSLAATKKITKIDMKGLDICKKHDERFKFYCENHKTLICSTCAIISHRKCNKVVEITTIAKESQCDGLRMELKTVITTTKRAVENLNEAKMRLSADVHRIPEKLNNMQGRLAQTIDEFAEKLKAEALAYRDKTIENWAASESECENHITNMTQSLDVIDDIALNGSVSEQFIIEKSMSDIVKKQTKDANTICSNLHAPRASCTFNYRFVTLLSSLKSSLKPDEFEMEWNVMQKTKLESIASIDLKQTDDDVGEPYYTGLDFLPDGRLVAVDNMNSKCLIYDDNLNLKSAYKLPYISPHSIVVVSGLDFLHVRKSNEITLNRTCKVNVKYDSISMKDYENFVASTIDNKKPVRIVSMSGEEKDFDIVFPSKKYPIDTSFCAYIQGQDKIVLTDKKADTVYIYDVKTGEKVVIKDELIKAPHSVAVGPYGHVFVSSEDTNSVVEITPGGRVLSSHKVDMKYPRYLAVSLDRRRLAVSDSTTVSAKLNLYQIIS